MKSQTIASSLLSLGLVACLSLGTAAAKDKEDARLAAKAKITKAAAEKTALAKVPDGKVKEVELEEENGKLVWSFDLSRPGTKNITEVQVDAITGKIVSVEVETPKEQADEGKTDKAKSEKK